MKKVVLILVMCAIVGSLSAQDAVFSVLLNKGQNSYGVQDNYQPILLGSGLKADETVNVVSNGYLALVHEQSGASIELLQKGSYSVAEIENEVLDQPTSVMAKYARFLIKKLHPDEKGRQNLNVTGAVERGEAGIIEVDLPNVNDVYSDEVIISWKRADDIVDYTLTIKDKLDETILKLPVKGTSYKLNLNRQELESHKMIILNVKAVDNTELRSPDYGIKRLDAKESKAIKDEFASLKSVANSDNVVDKLLIASFFEENKLFADAITYYKEAEALSPDPDGLATLYDNFMSRNGLKN